MTLDILLTAGDRERMAAALPEARMFDAIPHMHAACDRGEGWVLGAEDPRRANELLHSALEGFERLGGRFEAARTKEAMAEVSEAAEASSLLTEALETYESLRAKPQAERVRGLLS